MSLITFDVKDLALSEMIAGTNTKYAKIFSSSACTTVSDLVSVTEINQANLVKLALQLGMYSFLLSDLGNFP